MSRPVAITILLILGSLFLAVAWWGWSDINAWHSAINQCQTPVLIDQSSFWMFGMAAIALLPMLGFKQQQPERSARASNSGA